MDVPSRFLHWSTTLASLFCIRSDCLDLADLEKAYYNSTLTTTLTESSMLGELGQSSFSRYGRFDDIIDLEKPISMLQGHHSSWLNNLGHSSARYERRRPAAVPPPSCGCTTSANALLWALEET
ncbi:hypothetical protein OG21DRAFT_1486169 [Imleria badia]|nr:hypothetical protein OG21DRAFT_1486169 [Imleria badia]